MGNLIKFNPNISALSSPVSTEIQKQMGNFALSAGLQDYELDEVQYEITELIESFGDLEKFRRLGVPGIEQIFERLSFVCNPTHPNYVSYESVLGILNDFPKDSLKEIFDNSKSNSDVAEFFRNQL